MVLVWVATGALFCSSFSGLPSLGCCSITWDGGGGDPSPLTGGAGSDKIAAAGILFSPRLDQKSQKQAASNQLHTKENPTNLD
jgi:hypothetical protein